MKKLLAILAFIVIAILIAIILLGGSGFGFGNGSGNGSGNGANSLSEAVSTSTTPAKQEVTKEIMPAVEEPDDNSERIISVSVVEGDYFYENQRIDLDDLEQLLEETDEKFIVEVTDDNATLKAYQKLLNKLEQMDVSYTELS